VALAGIADQVLLKPRKKYFCEDEQKMGTPTRIASARGAHHPPTRKGRAAETSSSGGVAAEGRGPVASVRRRVRPQSRRGAKASIRARPRAEMGNSGSAAEL